MSKSANLSPAMQRLVYALKTYGHVDPIRDCGRTAAGGRIGINTIIALMDRGILREAKTRRGVHFPTTTPEQVWDDAHAEDARRAAEQAAHAADGENWVTVDDEGREAHMRTARRGGVLKVEQFAGAHRSWYVILNGVVLGSAGGDWAEARAAADSFESSHAYREAHADHAQWEIDQAAADQATPAYRHFSKAVHEGLSYRAALDILHAEALEMARDRDLGELVSAERRRLMAGGIRSALADRMALNNVARNAGSSEVKAAVQRIRDREHADAARWLKVHGSHCCATHGCKYGNADCPVVTGLTVQLYPCEQVGGCMQCTAPATVRAARGDDSATDRTRAAFDAITTLREMATYGDLPVTAEWYLAKLATIEAALTA